MKAFDGTPAKPGRSLSARSQDDKTILDSEVRTPSQPGNNPLPATVPNVETSAFEQKILSASLNGIYIYDLQAGANTYINSQYTRLTGYTLADLQALKGSEFFALFHPQDRQRVAGHMEHIGRAGDDETLELEYRFKTAEGRWIWCLSRDTVFEREERATRAGPGKHRGTNGEQVLLAAAAIHPHPGRARQQLLDVLVAKRTDRRFVERRDVAGHL